MNNRTGANIVFTLLILAFATMGISPACAFISGKMDVEICKSDGSVEIVQLDLGGEQQPAPDHVSMKDCLFCFASAHNHALMSAAPILKSPIAGNYAKLAGGTIAPRSSTPKTTYSTGPPAFIT
jgi:hypothetical protein